MESIATSLGLTANADSADRVAACLEKLMIRYDGQLSALQLTEDLASRLALGDLEERRSLVLFCESRHDEPSPPIRSERSSQGLVSKWRQKDRLKTTAVALVMCLNIGVDPPDIIKVSPCARTECWVDPLSMPAAKALDTIGKQLQSQYERWQPRAKYRMHLDPTTDDVRKLTTSSRRMARTERVLFHYNGHGVPRPTANGEIWVFNKSYTQYIPLSLYDLEVWVGSPAIYVFDCSSAGQVLISFKQFMLQRAQEMERFMSQGAYAQGQAQGASAGTFHPNGSGGNGLPGGSASQAGAGGSAAGCGGAGSASNGSHGGQQNPRAPDPMKNTILLCACGTNDVLPQSPDLPADLFTACLTTPIKIALQWSTLRSRLRLPRLDRDLVDRIPGKPTDRKAPVGELNWIFTAITDTIAWNVLPRALFQRLFRQDLLVASLFRNYLLADRIMRAHGCTPACHPRLPPTHQHPMWSAWDLAAEACLLQMPDLIDGVPGADYVPSPFFSQQLTAFELWLSHGAPDKRPPEQLPIVLQVLLSQVHRLRALVLLGRFLDMGVWAVDLALSVGIFPYVLKLLQTSAPDLRQTLVFIWTKILAWDASPAVQGDLVKDGGHAYFVKHLDARDAPVAPESRAQAAFVLAAICDAHPRGQVLCAQSGLLSVCLAHLPAALGVLASAFERRAAASLAARRREMGASVRRATPFARGREGDGEGEEGLGGGGAPRARSLGALAETTCAPDLFGGGLDPAALPPARALALLARWLLLLVGRLVQNSPEVTALALHEQAQSPLAEILASQDSDIRAAAVCALGALIGVPQAESDEAGGGGSQHGGAGVPAAASSDSVAASGQEAAAGVEAGQPPAPSTEADRLVQERAIACVLLEAVYDASPTVRAELAAALARFAVGHSLLFQDAVAAHRRALAAARVSSAQPARAGAPPPPSGGAAGGAGSAPSATGAGFEARAVGKDPRKDRDSSAPAREEATPAMAAPRGKAAPRAMSAGDLGGGGEGASPEGTSRARPAPQGKPPPPGGLASPGVRVRYDSSYEPLLRVGLGEVAGTPGGYDDPEEGAGKTCGYATADAARVGGGLYAAVVEALCTLATDPSPRVAATGRAALRAAGVLILPRPAAPAGGQQGGSGSVGGGAGARAAGASPMTSPRPAHRSGSARELGAAPSPGSASVAAERVASMLSKAWQPRGWRGGAAAAAAVPPPQPQGGTPAGSTPGSPNTSPCAPQLCARPLYTLRHAGEPESLGAQGLGLARVASAAAALGGGAGEGSRAASARASAASLVGLEGTAVPIVAGGATITLTGAGVGGSMSAARAASPAAARATSLAAALPPPATPPPVQPPAPVPPGPLPKSPAYLAACEYFTYPLLAPQALEVPGAAHATWLLEPDPRTRAEREWARAERLAACGSMHAPGAAFRLREQVTTVESEGERVVALGWDALRPHLVTADGEGYLRVSSTAGHQALNRFHVAAPPPGAPAAVAPPAPTLLRGVWVLNEIHSGLLATGAADGAVRIWRNFAQRGQQRLATAWQSVLLPAHGAPGTAAQYALDPVANRLFASGGQRAERVYLWDLEREACAAQLRCELGRAASVSSLAASSRSGAVFAAADDGTVHVFDVRAPAAVGAAQARRQRLTDLVLEPGGLEHQLVLGYPTGQLAFLDARVASSDGGARLEVGVWKTIEAHSKGGVSAMAAHPHAPFLATATRSQVVKLWSAGGDQVGVVRAHTSFLSHRLGPITCMGWAPYDPVLAAGGDDPIAAVYAVEPQPTGRKSGSVEHLAAQLRSASLSSLPSAGF